MADRGSCQLANQNPSHSLRPVAAPHITFCAKLPLEAPHVKPFMTSPPYLANVGDLVAICVPKLVAVPVFANACAHLPSNPAPTLQAAIFITHLPNQNPSHSVSLPCSVCCFFVFSNSR